MEVKNFMCYEILELLYQLGVTANYRGFRYIVTAVELILEDPQRLLAVTKDLYPDVAKRCKTTSSGVERNIRTAIRAAWSHNPQLVMELMRYPLSSPPTTSQMLACLAARIDRDRSR